MFDRHDRVRKPRRFGCVFWLIFFILILLISLSWLLAQWLQALMNPYTSYADQTKIAQVRAIPTHVPGYMDVELKTFASDGHMLSDNHYLIKGNVWRLEGDVITIPEKLNFTGAYSGYKLIQFDSRYVPATFSNKTSSVSIDHASDDQFFKILYSHHAPVIQAYKMYSNYVPDDGKSYDIFIIQNGLSAKSSS